MTAAAQFPTNASRVPSAYRAQTEEVAGYLKTHPEAVVKVEGHTDNRGSYQYNLKLSRKRAESVKRMLQKMGVEKERISTEGFSYTRPIADNSTAAGRAKNRRVETRVEEEKE
ncbi:MAG TPA: OmpA family protein [Verrucomicrobiae bacterium]|nr:OmpA family protein [Verrucomicrobiae bacterium]